MIMPPSISVVMRSTARVLHHTTSATARANSSPASFSGRVTPRPLDRV